ncbi:MAG: hypothetical protein PHN88_10910 [Ignavibacteria bacterium]|nr:hypothetical protein [Ignavibacteria bacterium]
MRLAIITLLILFFFKSGAAQQNITELPKTNFAVFAELLNDGLGPVDDKVTILGPDKIYKIDAGKECSEKKFFLNVFKQRFANRRFVYEKETDSTNYIVFAGDFDFKTVYSKPAGKSLLGDEYTERNISVSFSYSIFKAGSSEIESNRKFSKSFKDEVNIKDYDYVQNSDFDFMNSKLPEKSFFGKIFLPAVIVITSAAAIVLFFTIRSK